MDNASIQMKLKPMYRMIFNAIASFVKVIWCKETIISLPSHQTWSLINL